MRISIKKLTSYSWLLRPLFWLQRRNYGRILTPGLLWGRVPGLFGAVAFMYGVLNRKRSPIDPILRCLVIVRVSQMNWCEFCVDINSSTFLKQAGSLDQLEALDNWRVSECFSPMEKTVLTYAEAMTDSNQRVDDELMEKLKGFFNEDEIVELTGLVAFANLSSKFNSALDVEPQGFCKKP